MLANCLGCHAVFASTICDQCKPRTPGYIETQAWMRSFVLGGRLAEGKRYAKARTTPYAHIDEGINSQIDLGARDGDEPCS